MRLMEPTAWGPTVEEDAAKMWEADARRKKALLDQFNAPLVYGGKPSKAKLRAAKSEYGKRVDEAAYEARRRAYEDR